MKRLLALTLLICTFLCLAACGISDEPKDVRANLKASGYKVKLYTADADFRSMLNQWDIDSDDVDAVLTATGEDSDERLIVLFCEDEKSAKYAEADLIALLEGSDAETYFEDIEDICVERCGTVLCLGHKDMIKAAK